MNRTLVLIAIAVLMQACGGGGSNDNGNAGSGSGSGPNPSPTPETKQTVGRVELGPVKDAAISVKTLDGRTLYLTKTRDDGSFVIKVDELKDTVDALDPSISLVRITAQGGIDTDPNDDGVIEAGEAVAVKGTVSGLVPLDVLYEENGYRINLLTTLISDILSHQDAFDQGYIDFLAQKLEIQDIDQNGRVDIDDLIYYEMTTDDTVLERTLRETYLAFIHEGNATEQAAYLDDLQYEHGFAEPDIRKLDGAYLVQLKTVNPRHSLQYGVSTDHRSPELRAYLGGDIRIHPPAVLYFEECSPTLGCYQTQMVHFTDQSFTHDYIRESPPSGRFDEVISQLNQAREDLSSAQADLERQQAELQRLLEEKQRLDAELSRI